MQTDERHFKMMGKIEQRNFDHCDSAGIPCNVSSQHEAPDLSNSHNRNSVALDPDWKDSPVSFCVSIIFALTLT